MKGKVEYLNELYMETKKQNEENAGVIKTLKEELETLRESVNVQIQNEGRDANVQELIEQNQALNEQLTALSAEKDSVEKDLEELLKEFSNVKGRYEGDIRNIRAEKDKQIAELKKRASLKDDQSNHIPELNEELEELRDQLEQKEKIIVELRSAGIGENSTSNQDEKVIV